MAVKTDLMHFLLWRPACSDERQKNIKAKQPCQEDIIGELLFGKTLKKQRKQVKSRVTRQILVVLSVK